MEDRHAAGAGRGRPIGRRAAARRRLPEAESGGLVVATYNVHKCVGVDRRHDPQRVAEVLRELGADIICLQEVGARQHRQRPLDQEAFFAETTGLRLVSGPLRTDRRGRFGNAILTRFPVLAVRHVDLTVAGCEPRGAIDAELAAGDRVLRVVATHLGLRGPERQEQTQRLLAAIAAAGAGGGHAILMMGDLNEWRGRRGGIPALDRAFGRTPAPRTFPSWCPVLPLDRIYAAPPIELGHFRVHRSPLARLASDHLPLRARLAWPDA